VLKGIVPILIGRWAGMDATALAIVALAAVVGHDFSIFLRFRGGKGVATTIGAAVALAPLATVLSGVAWLIVLGVSGYASLASLIALALLPVFLALTHQPVPYVIVGIVLFLLAAGKHADNISRLMSGTERSFRRPDADGS
jgi:glycerol-3-phosphate acyltransferase PlsY